MTDEVMPVPEADEGSDAAGSLLETVDEPVSFPTDPPRPFWQRVWAWLTDVQTPESLAEQARELDAAIAAEPENPVNYMLRGEYHLTNENPDAAEADFRLALDLASQQVEHANWGFVAQVVADRAQVGLKQAQQRRRW
ncbi:MAG: hypothetical protein H6672_04770 [Anaerolineaceae bacterium]|nr:hypothetical protein [Anaerolineaceae bacterium]